MAGNTLSDLDDSNVNLLMAETLLRHIRKFVAISEEEFERIIAFFEMMEVKKKVILHKAHSVCQYHYFVVEGCLRMYFINDKGIEQTTEFSIENWWLTDHHSYSHRSLSEFYIQAAENSTIIRIKKAKEEELLNEFPALEKYFRSIYQKAMGAAQMRTKFFNQFTKEELYHHFCSNYPEFVQRMPQYLIASFLGFTPEYLSEIRKRKFLKLL